MCVIVGQAGCHRGVIEAISAKIVRTLSMCTLLTWFVTAAGALDPHTLISQYGHTAWRAQDGFPSQIVSITQTTDGYIWIVAEDGESLFRFDGVRFVRWIPPDRRFPLHAVNSVLGARDGSLWIGASQGLVRWKDGQYTNYTTPEASAGINAILEDHTGKIWVTRYGMTVESGSLCWVNGSALECYGKKYGNPSRYGFGITEDSTGDIWFASSELYRWHHGSFSTYLAEQTRNQSGPNLPQVIASPSGNIWAGIDGTGPKAGVQKFSDGKWSSYVVPGFDGRTVMGTTLFVDKRQELWVGTTSNGLTHVHDGVTDHYGAADGLSSDGVDCLFEDREGNLWVGTDGGVDLFRNNAVASFTKAQGLVGNDVNAILTINRDSVWVSDDEGLSVIQTGASTSVRRPIISGHSVQSMFLDSLGQVWLNVDKRLVTYQNGQYAELKKADGTPPVEIWAVATFAEDTAGNLWVLNRTDNPQNDDLVVIRDRRVQQVFHLGESLTAYLVADPHGGIWTLTEQGVLKHYLDGIVHQSTRFDREFSPTNLSVDADDTVWVATNRGLIRWRDGKLALLDSRNGLPCSGIYSALQDDRGSHWLRARCGILRIAADQWDRWAKSPDSKIQVTAFGALDGFRFGTWAGAVSPAVAKTRDGKIWFANGTSVLMVDPGRDASLPPSPVHIEELVADHQTYDSPDNVALPHLRGTLEIDYTALSFKIPQRVQFRYKLEGHDEGWQDAGTRRQAFYNDLSPGKYRFRVIACNSDGVWNEAGTFVDFSIRPAWYQTLWFRLCCAVAFLLMLWGAYLLRIRQVESQFAARLDVRVDERTRIARELHDTLLQSFQGAVFQFQAARRLFLRNADNVSQVMDEAIQAAEAGITEGRLAIHDLRPEAAIQRGLPDLLNAAGRELAEAQEPNELVPGFRVTVEGEARSLVLPVQDEIYRIAREVIRNAFRHAAAGLIEVEIRYDDDHLRLRIRDDGKGIDPKILEVGGRSRHWGIPGMRERAKRIGSQLDFWSEKDAGTEAELKVPAAKVYEKRQTNKRFRLFRWKSRDGQHS